MAKRDFHIAVVTSNVAMISELITNGRDINELDANGDTPLLRALRSKNENMAVELLRFGADPSIVNEKNASWTAEKIAKKLQLDKAASAIAATLKKRSLVRRASIASNGTLDSKGLPPPPPATNVNKIPRAPIVRRGSMTARSVTADDDDDRQSVTSRSDNGYNYNSLQRSLTRSNSGGTYGYKLDGTEPLINRTESGSTYGFKVDSGNVGESRLSRTNSVDATALAELRKVDTARSNYGGDANNNDGSTTARKLGKKSSIHEMNPYLPRQVPVHNRFNALPPELKSTENAADKERAEFCDSFTCVVTSCVVM